MARRTIYLPDAIEQLVRDAAQDKESFSAATVRLIEAGARALKRGKWPAHIGIGEGPEDLGINAEKYLREIFRAKR